MTWKRLVSWPVHQKQLHDVDIELGDATLERASLFPFFDRQGEVHAHMLVWPEAPWIVMLDAVRGLIQSSYPLKLDVCFGELQNLHDDRFDRYAYLWHFDPWWLLAHSRFIGNPAVPVLKRTNAVLPLADFAYAGYFSRDLQRSMSNPAAHLPEREEVAASRPAVPGLAWRIRRSWPMLGTTPPGHRERS